MERNAFQKGYPKKDSTQWEEKEIKYFQGILAHALRKNASYARATAIKSFIDGRYKKKKNRQGDVP